MIPYVICWLEYTLLTFWLDGLVKQVALHSSTFSQIVLDVILQLRRVFACPPLYMYMACCNNTTLWGSDKAQHYLCSVYVYTLSATLDINSPLNYYFTSAFASSRCCGQICGVLWSRCRPAFHRWQSYNIQHVSRIRCHNRLLPCRWNEPQIPQTNWWVHVKLLMFWGPNFIILCQAEVLSMWLMWKLI